MDDLKNRSHRANLQIINVPKDSEIRMDKIKFTSDLLKDVMRDQVFEKPPELERAHRALAHKPRDGQFYPALIHKLQSALPSFNSHYVILDGDLNCAMGPNLDRSNPKPQVLSKMASEISASSNQTGCVDPLAFLQTSL